MIKSWLKGFRMYYLDGDCRGAQLGLHALKTAKVSIDGLSQGTCGLAGASGTEILKKRFLKLISKCPLKLPARKWSD